MAHGSGLSNLLAALERHGSRVRPRGGYYMAQCPVHDDRTESLSLSQGDKGAKLNCHAGCEYDDIRLALDLGKTDLFDNDRNEKVTAVDLWMPCQMDGCSGHKAAEYKYTDAEGRLLFGVARCSRKGDGCSGFAQWIPDLSKKYGKKWGLPAQVPRVPYRLPQVLEAARAGRRIFLVEGEKDAERLMNDYPGEVATTQSSGAGKSKWRPENTKYFAGASEVIIIADCDETGLEYAEQASYHLGNVVEKVTVMCSPLLKNHADFSDHRDYGYGLDDLQVVPFESAARRPQMVIRIEERHADVPIVFEGFNQEAVERFLCGSMLRFGLAYDINSADIKDGRLRAVTDAVAQLAAEKRPLTPETVALRIEGNEQAPYDKVLSFLLDLEKHAFSDGDKPLRAARLLRDRSARRGLAFSLEAVAEAARDERRPIPEVLDYMRRMTEVQDTEYAAIDHAYTRPVQDAFGGDLLAEVAREAGLAEPAAPVSNVQELHPAASREQAARATGRA